MADNIVQVVIQASDQTAPAFDSAKAGVKEAAAEIAAGAEQISGAARHGAEGMGSLGGALREYRSEMRQENRMARFLAADIASMGIASKGAAMEVTGLISAFAMGGGLGIAIEVVKMGVKLIADQIAESSRTASKAVDAMMAKARAAKDGLAEVWYQAELTGKAETNEGEAYQDAFKKKAAALKNLEAYQVNLARAQKLVKDGQASSLDVAAQEEAIALAKAEDIRQTARLTDALHKLQEQRDRLKWSEASSKLAHGGQGPEEVGEGATDTKGIGSAKRSADAVLAERRRVYEGMAASYAMEAEAYRKMRLAEMALDDDKAQQAHELLEEEHREGEKLYQESLRRQKDELDAKKAAQKEMMKSYFTPLAHAASSLFSEMTTNGKLSAKSIGNAFKGLAGEMVSHLAQVGAEWVAEQLVSMAASRSTNVTTATSDAAVMANEAFKSQAGIPVAGPALAAAAAEAAYAYGMTNAALAASAAGGWDVPAGGPFLMLGHGKEMMLPEKHANVIRDIADGGGGGGGHTHLHFHGPTDANSIRRYVRSPAYQREVAAARRDGHSV